MTTIQELFYEINNHLLEDQQPSAYLNEISKTKLFEVYPFNMLDKLKKTEQSLKHHPEGNVWNHTMLVIDEAAKVKDISKDKKVFMWAALLHDIGKPDTTMIRKGRITSYDHDKLGAELSVRFLSELTDDTAFVKKVSTLVRWHMQILFVVNNLPFADIKGMKKSIDINEVALFGFCDRMGRTHAEHDKEEENIKKFLEKCK
ncbi:HDIG domain-containing protein [Ruminiclostridium herbifermentans]|uniref:HDIG domain-containing protein n=1 Tax=Ruminiclostridium herbifermentans TaxID=2488810 RepID=A0A4V6YE66_9FIRM|nr:HDIG domain-containing metalloprotein [Ruminiclostridium herbifermentans]QNU68624.1 HDIG domain-containing protein [Ruminiclostridium herbifermentans]